MTRYVPIGHRLVGWNAVKSRVEQLDLELSDEQVKVSSNNTLLQPSSPPANMGFLFSVGCHCEVEGTG